MKNTKQLIDLIKNDCKAKGIKLHLPKTRKVVYSDNPYLLSSGWFSDSKKKLACGVGGPQIRWIQTLTHEYCHSLQWIEGDKVWTDLKKGMGTTRFFKGFLNGEKFTKKQVDTYLGRSQRLELDCEQRTMELLAPFCTQKEYDSFVQKANSYILFYTVLKHTQKWYDNPPYHIKEIVDKMPPYFCTMEQYADISVHLLDLYKKKCYN